MAKTNFTSVDDYIAIHPPNVQEVLHKVRGVIRKAIPKAEEAISYQIPTLKFNGQYVIYFAGWTKHYSLYPANERLVAAFQQELVPYPMSRGTIRFPLAEPIPAKLIAGIAKFLFQEASERADAKAAKTKPAKKEAGKTKLNVKAKTKTKTATPKATKKAATSRH